TVWRVTWKGSLSWFLRMELKISNMMLVLSVQSCQVVAFIIPQNRAHLQVSQSQKELPPPKAAGALLGHNLVLLDPSEAVGAVDGAILAGLEGNLAGLAAGCADGVVHLALTGAGRTGAVLAGVTASLAALGLVLKTAGCVELLLAGSPNKLLAAVLANYSLVFEHCGISSCFVLARGRIRTTPWFWGADRKLPGACSMLSSSGPRTSLLYPGLAVLSTEKQRQGAQI